MGRKLRTRRYDPTLNLKLAGAAYQNARSLLGGADLLSASGRYGPAVSLTVTAIEELGKAGVFRMAVDLDRRLGTGDVEGEVIESVAETPLFDYHLPKKLMGLSFGILAAAIRSQPPNVQSERIDPSTVAKLGQVLIETVRGQSPTEEALQETGRHALLTEFIQSYFSQLGTVSRRFEQLRLGGLYVDIRDGEICRPETIRQEEFQSIRIWAEQASAGMEDIVRDGLPSRLLDFLEAWVRAFGMNSSSHDLK